MANKNMSELPFIDSPISYAEFAEKYLLPNQACILGEWATRGWPGRADFTLPDGGVNVDRLKSVYGKCENVSVSDCSSPSYGYDSAMKMNVGDFLDMWHSGRCLYWKDFHFQRDAPHYKPFELPIFFRSDWLNEYWDTIRVNNGSNTDDFRFIYAGPAGTWTPLHCDVIQSHSWSANLVGVKRWLMFEQGEMAKLEPFVREKQEGDMDKLARIARQVGARFADFYQQPGEIVFVPSEWGHQVRNETDAVSLNHNWMNAFNVNFVFKYLEGEWNQTERELTEFGVVDSGDLGGSIENIISASGGCGIKVFIDLLTKIATKRMQQVEKVQGTDYCDISSLEQILQRAKERKKELEPGDSNHAAIDLVGIKTLIENKLLPFSGLRLLELRSLVEKLLCDIKTALKQ